VTRSTMFRVDSYLYTVHTLWLCTQPVMCW